jgi:hypothetical protein
MNKGLHTLLIILIAIGIASLGFLSYYVINDYLDSEKIEAQWELEQDVAVDYIDDNTYHINLGDGTSCFLMEKIGDSMSFKGVNVSMVLMNNDTIMVAARQKSGQHLYKFAFHDFYDDEMPNVDNVSFDFN